MAEKPESIKLSKSEPTYRDIEGYAINGFLGLLMHLALGLANLVLTGITATVGFTIVIQIFTVPLWFLMFNSYVIVNPNEAVVAQFFGKYSATLKSEGFQFFLNPLYQKTKISLRINNFESNKLKVNDVNANPIDIAAVVVWRVFDAAEALF
ncbi:MAG: SPFH domain-containing protein, partial [Candidatus Thermoplasmatota archaeon]|nr:SPFH domain-containing protein [Candidatus Thermoplasmatota archaeon]